jgi:hypothetical protein
MSEAPVHETLRRLFDVVLREAEQNPALARKLVQAIGEDFASHRQPPKRSSRKAFDAAQLHAVNVLRLHGESALRGKLEQIKAVEDLKTVAKASGLVLSASSGKARPSRGELIAGIVEAAKHYDAQRSAATA